MPSRFVALGTLAWLSHLLLDSFYNHGSGIPIFWPVSDASLSLPIPRFSTLDLKQAIFSNHNLSVFGIEFLAYSPLVVAAYFVSRMLGKRNGDPLSHSD